MFSSIKQTRKGFTLIELLVVIAIIGILSSVVLASLSTAREKSRDGKRVSDIGQIQLALELYFDTYQSYPSTTPVATAAVTGGAVEGGVQVLANSGMLPKAPIPPNGGRYQYRGINSGNTECYDAATSPCTSYRLAVTLERDDAAVLGTDADDAVVAGFAAPTAIPFGPGAAGNAIYSGVAATVSCEANTAATREKCYDIKP